MTRKKPEVGQEVVVVEKDANGKLLALDKRRVVSVGRLYFSVTCFDNQEADNTITSKCDLKAWLNGCSSNVYASEREYRDQAMREEMFAEVERALRYVNWWQYTEDQTRQLHAIVLEARNNLKT